MTDEAHLIDAISGRMEMERAAWGGPGWGGGTSISGGDGSELNVGAPLTKTCAHVLYAPKKIIVLGPITQRKNERDPLPFILRITYQLLEGSIRLMEGGIFYCSYICACQQLMKQGCNDKVIKCIVSAHIVETYCTLALLVIMLNDTYAFCFREPTLTFPYIL